MVFYLSMCWDSTIAPQKTGFLVTGFLFLFQVPRDMSVFDKDIWLQYRVSHYDIIKVCLLDSQFIITSALHTIGVIWPNALQ